MRNFSNNNNNDRGFKNFTGNSFGGNRGGFGGSRGGFGGGRGGDRPQMFSAVCDKCGVDCEVPFRPSGEKPVYCSNCFEKTDSREGGQRFEERRPRENSFRSEAPRMERPRMEAPRNEVSYKRDFEELNRKMDRLLDLLTAKEATKEVKKPKKAAKKIEEVKEIEVAAETQE
jgi:CxxC-x17-CxxC domain-containing protein